MGPALPRYLPVSRAIGFNWPCSVCTSHSLLQDMTTRLWDLRYPSTSFALLKAHIGAIRALRFRCACYG